MKTTDEDGILLEWPNKDYLAQLTFVQKIENHLKLGGKIEIIEDDKKPKVIKYNLNEQRSFSGVVQDFLKLTETAISRTKK